MPDSLDAPRLLERLQETLDAEVSHQRDVLAPLGGQTDLMLDAVATLLRGGKRVRASFLYWGYRAAGGADSDALVRCAASMERTISAPRACGSMAILAATISSFGPRWEVLR